MEVEVYRRMGEMEECHWWFVARRRILEHLIASLKLPSPCRILDIGCGTGGNLPMLCRFGEVLGMDMSDIALQRAQQRGVCPVVRGSLPWSMPETPLFDLVTLLDIVEHVDDDRAALASAGDRLAQGGYVLITVPAFPFLWGGHDVRHHHKRRYRRTGLVNLVRQAGLQPVYASYYNFWLFPLIAAFRALKNVLSISGSDDERHLPAWLNGLLGAVFSSERHLLGKVRLPMGLSLVVIARK